jgi:glycerol-3-phosphate O-acyltransferase
MPLDMEQIVLSYPKLKERIRGKPTEKTKAQKIILEIAAQFSRPAIMSFEKMLDTVLPTIYDGIHLTIPEDLDFKQLVRDNNVVLVPNHQSHADYIALNYQVFKQFDFPVYIAGGINLNIFPIGTLFRKSGCFFIRRSFNNDVLYKLTLEAYLFYLLTIGVPIEFFFEGGRSRTGKLLPPRYGLFTMLLEAHNAIDPGKRKPLHFLPVTIIHEYVPEQKSLVRELTGAKKKKESPKELLKLFKLLSYQLGNIHIKMGHPIKVQDFEPGEVPKDYVQQLAFDCFRKVGKRLMVTPTALVSMVLLDDPTGALNWSEILQKCRKIVGFCKSFDIPITDSLNDDRLEETLGRALNLLVGNRKISEIGKPTKGAVFYAIKTEARMELMYFKNSILHHFLVPWIINNAWIKLFTGKVNNTQELKQHFIQERRQLKFEFYLPTIKEMIIKALRMLSVSVGREIKTLDECLTMSHKELYSIASDLGCFSRTCTFIIECYYLSALTINALHIEMKNGFKTEQFLKKSKDVFEVEKSLGRVIKHPESYTLPVIKTSLKYFENQKLVELKDGLYKVVDLESVHKLILDFEENLLEHLKFNIRG